MKKMTIILACVLFCGLTQAATSLIDNDPNNGNGSFEFGKDFGTRPAGTSTTSILPVVLEDGWKAVSSGWGGFWDNNAHSSEGTAYCVVNSGAIVTYTCDPIAYAAQPGDTFSCSFKAANNTAGGIASFDVTLILDPDTTTQQRVSLGTFDGVFAVANEFQTSDTYTKAISGTATEIALEIKVRNNTTGGVGNDQVYMDEVSLTVEDGIPPADIGFAGAMIDWTADFGNGGFEFNTASETVENGFTNGLRFGSWYEGVTDSDDNGKIDIVLPGGWKLEAANDDSVSWGFDNASTFSYSGDLDGDGEDTAVFANGNNSVILTNDSTGYTAAAGDILMVEFGLGSNNGSTNATRLTPYLIFDGEEVAISETIYYNKIGIDKQVVEYAVTEEDAGKVVGLKFLLASYSTVNQVYLDGIVMRVMQEAIIYENGGTATFDINVSQDPMQQVVVPVVIQSDDDPYLNSLTSAPASLTFNSSNYATTQSLTINTVDNADIDGDKTYWITSVMPEVITDPNIYTHPELIRVVVIDEEFPRIDYASVGDVTVAEGGIGGNSATATFSVTLNGLPTQDVTVTLEDASDPAQVVFDVSPKTITFTSIGQSIDVTITAVDDETVEAISHSTTLNLTSTSLDVNYDGLATAVDVTILENECDATGYTKSTLDKNGDCIINMADFAEFAQIWLECLLPNGGVCN